MFRTAHAALVRAAAYPSDLVLPDWPDLTTDQPAHWIDWLTRVWELPEFSDVVTQAAPDLATRIDAALRGDPVSTRRLRRLTETVLRYLLRWTTRATPFGRFAGIAPAAFGAHTAVAWGEGHHDIARPDELHIARHVAAAEQDRASLRTAQVVTNALGYARGGAWVLPAARTADDRLWDVEIELTQPIHVAVQAARTPIVFADLATITAEKLATCLDDVEVLLTALVREGVLISDLRPPITTVVRAAHHTPHPDSHDALSPTGDRTTVDRRIDAAVTLPPSVVREAQEAANTLTAIAPRLPGWDTYHAAFLDRWGPGAAVPLRDVLTVLGFPRGYRGMPRPTPMPFTATDSLLMGLAQQSALDGGAEVVLDDDLLDQLTVQDDRPPIPHTELRFTLAAPTTGDLDQGRFTLNVVSGARHAGVAAARFLHLLEPAEQDQFRNVYQGLPTAMPGARLVQLSAPPLQARLAALARTPQFLPVLPVGDFHPDPAHTVDDLAVAGDAHRLWLESRTTGHVIEPLLLNAVLLATAQQPLTRFLTEIWTAWNAPCTPFKWGYAGNLPFLPKVRRGRSILHPARWAIPSTALPTRAGTWSQWHDAWARRREGHHIPRHVLLGDDDVRIRLDLDEDAHLALLRSHLDRNQDAVLTEAPGPSGWIGGRPTEILLTLTSTPPTPQPAPRPVRPTTTIQHRPGSGQWLEARFHGPTDPILAYLARTGLPRGAWFIRYPNPDHHLRVRVPLHDITHAQAAHLLAGHAERLHDGDLLTDYSLNTYRPETRYGTGQTLAAAEAMFAADSRTALSRLSGDRQASTAAGMLAIAHAFTGDAPRWLADHAPHRGGPRLDRAQLAAAREYQIDQDLLEAVAAYRVRVDRDGLDVDRILGDLLHMHHARMIGVDLDSERHCLRLARSLALTSLAHLNAARTNAARTDRAHPVLAQGASW
ncbi:lantibiotic dehydratase [Promicromonospora sp. MS192]|uniref:lantibiotic dehydratase n=1 Tax=Promicromonospora sp. MS192 TaxID=3412684 RepID=UPI003C2B5574